jgi:hypothetical protein
VKSGIRHRMRDGAKKSVRKRRKNVVAKKLSSARLELAGDKKRLSKTQTRAASTTSVAAEEEAGSLAAQHPMGWHFDHPTANQIATQIFVQHRQFIVVWRSPGLAPVAPSATSMRNVTIGANVAAEKMSL